MPGFKFLFAALKARFIVVAAASPPPKAPLDEGRRPSLGLCSRLALKLQRWRVVGATSGEHRPLVRRLPGDCRKQDCRGHHGAEKLTVAVCGSLLDEP